MSLYDPNFNTRISKPNQRCLQHAAAQSSPPLKVSTWAREKLEEAAVAEIAIKTMRHIDLETDSEGLDLVIRALNKLSAAHTRHDTLQFPDGEPQTMSGKPEPCFTKQNRGRP